MTHKQAASVALQPIYDALAALGVAKVTIEFSGSGDEGFVDDITTRPTVDLPKKVTDLLDEFVFTHVLWNWNNEGSSGCVHLNVKARTATAKVDWPETTYITKTTEF